MVMTDRLSAFDGFLPKGIPQRANFKSNCYKVHGTNCRYRSELVNCNPDPNVAVGHLCALKVEMVIRIFVRSRQRI
jgi:phosphoribosylaminoimidazole-succinocarboxamide synthase